MMSERVIRLALDINVFYADLRGAQRRIRPTACSDLVSWVRDGGCPAGPVQLVISVPIIENWADVLRRKLGYARGAAASKAWLLRDYALEGPVAQPPSIVVGAGHIPFATETEMVASLAKRVEAAQRGKLLDEVADDRHVLLSALAGEADILATADLDDFVRGAAIRFARDDVIVYPTADHALVIAKPGFVAHWLRRGVVPDVDFVRGRPDEFVALAPLPPWLP